jgi:hypothetical protein
MDHMFALSAMGCKFVPEEGRLPALSDLAQDIDAARADASAISIFEMLHNTSVDRNRLLWSLTSVRTSVISSRSW